MAAAMSLSTDIAPRAWVWTSWRRPLQGGDCVQQHLGCCMLADRVRVPWATFAALHTIPHDTTRMPACHIWVQAAGSRTEGSHQRLAAGLGVEQDPGLCSGPEAAVEACSTFAVEQSSQEIVAGQSKAGGERQARLRGLQLQRRAAWPQADRERQKPTL